MLTDNTWSAKLPESDNWMKATEQKYGKIVIAPNFKTKRTSWIER